MEELLNAAPAEEMPATVEVVDIQFRPGQKIYFFDPDGLALAVGDHVIMDTARGAEYGTCTGANHQIPTREVVAPLRKILRKANHYDERVHAENRAKEKRAYDVCLQRIEAHGLDMQLVSAECAFDGSKLLFYFTADERVDFRELVKDLAGVFHTRIELRQIGVRDKAKMVGGLGICGRPFCCASFLEDFQPVSIKMAKTQNLSLNPTKISGTCGRLMCCLKYEQETYEDLIRSSPKVDSLVDTPEGRGTVVESLLLRQRVKVQMENDPETIHLFHIDDIAVLRSGKAKKNDPPVPADLAPISGSGKHPRQNREEEAAPVLDSIRFRYSTESIAEEVTAPEAQQEEPKQRPPRRKKPVKEQQTEEEQPKAEQPRPKKPKQPREPKEQKDQKEPKEQKEPREPRPPKPPKPPKREPEAEAFDTEALDEAEFQQSNKPRRRPGYRRYRKPNKPSAE